MKKQQPSIDGFIPRRAGALLGESKRPIGQPRPAIGKVEETGSDQIRPSGQLARTEIDESLRQIDDETETPQSKKRRFGRRRKTPTKLPSKRKKIIKRLVILLVIIIIGVAGFLGIQAFLASNSIFKGNLFDIFQNQPLKKDANGRSNILVFGTSEDDPDHGGANLTDSIMVVSIDQDKKNAYMVSVPRDLYVDYGATCPEGYRGKINSMYDCFSNSENDEAAGATALKNKVGDVLGLDVQYYAHLNYTVVRDAVNAVGGVDVKIESSDPRGILDRNFDWKCGYQCHYVNYKNGEVAHLDGEHALALARARNASGGYGLPGGNFDREKNQQKIIKALREKASSAGTLTNIGKVTGLINAFGSNLKTNFETKEIQTLMSLGSDIPSDSIQPISLVEEGEELVTTGNMGGASIVRPIAGLYDYSQIKAYVNKKLNSNAVSREAASVVVLNGSGITGVGQQQASKLEGKGFVISAVDTAPEGAYAAVEVYQIGAGNTATKAKLAELYGVTVKASAPPVIVAEGTKFVVIFGKDPSSSNQ